MRGTLVPHPVLFYIKVLCILLFLLSCSYALYFLIQFKTYIRVHLIINLTKLNINFKSLKNYTIFWSTVELPIFI